MFGLASGIFFLGYLLFEVPSNVMLERVGARLWIARIMISLGTVSAATAFVTGATQLLRRCASCSAWRRPASSRA